MISCATFAGSKDRWKTGFSVHHSWQEPMTLPTAWQSDERCGGPSSKRDDKELVVPRLLGQAREDFFSLKEHSPHMGRTSQDLDAIAQEAVVSKLADSTKRS